MKTAFLYLAFFILSINVFSQQDTISILGWDVTKAYFGTGETCLTNGVAASVTFEKEKSILMIDYSETLGEFIYFYQANKWLSVGGSGGFWNKCPWFGPIASMNFFNGTITTLNWIGWSFGDTEVEETELKLYEGFIYNEFDFNFSSWTFYYTNSIYKNYPAESIFGIKKEIQIMKRISLSVGGAYMLNKEHFLWSSGLNYKFK